MLNKVLKEGTSNFFLPFSVELVGFYFTALVAAGPAIAQPFLLPLLNVADSLTISLVESQSYTDAIT